MANIVKYETPNGEVQLDKQTIKNYLVSGDADRVTDQELELFINLCKYQKLNPFLRDAYLVKFGDKPANMIVGKDFFIKRAYANENFKGYTAGVIVLKQDGDLENRAGSFYAKQVESLVGAWCKVEFADGTEFYHTVAFDEYNTGKSTWVSKPATMIRKVALVQALREAFPEDYQGLYDSSEMGVNEEVLPTDGIKIKSRTISKEQFDLLMKTLGEDAIVDFCKSKGYNDAAKIKVDEYEKLIAEATKKKLEEDEEVIEYEDVDPDFKDLQDEDKNFEINDEEIPF
ncbi:phage recombination protein Bet [Peptoniphilus duerdenii]|uniref:phage recombination protein Bet n=1 Tax=Peptoniphilus duerdenii TaxID=507750 RepID=UPI00288AE548|nr:phage recombination protein Bet [Peptoniphilus duerdenii]